MKRLLLFTLLLGLAHSVGFACTLTLGYRTSAKVPLIAAAPDNSGLYYDIFSAAAKKIGCDLKVIRGPKNRILQGLAAGTIDFYPGMAFTPPRVKDYYFIENGLPGGLAAITLADVPALTSVDQIREKGMISLRSLGGPVFVPDITELVIPELTLERALQLLRAHRADIYVYEKPPLEYYLVMNPAADVRMHDECCGGSRPYHLGFSRRSPNYSERPNPDFDEKRPVSPENFPASLADSVARRFAEALLTMAKSGETGELYERYYR